MTEILEYRNGTLKRHWDEAVEEKGHCKKCGKIRTLGPEGICFRCWRSNPIKRRHFND